MTRFHARLDTEKTDPVESLAVITNVSNSQQKKKQNTGKISRIFQWKPSFPRRTSSYESLTSGILHVVAHFAPLLSEFVSLWTIDF